jgi:hypothetical protein
MVLQGAHRRDDGVKRAAADAQDLGPGRDRRQHPAPALRTFRDRTAAAGAAMRDQRRSYARMFHVSWPGDAPR